MLFAYLRPDNFVRPASYPWYPETCDSDGLGRSLSTYRSHNLQLSSGWTRSQHHSRPSLTRQAFKVIGRFIQKPLHWESLVQESSCVSSSSCQSTLAINFEYHRLATAPANAAALSSGSPGSSGSGGFPSGFRAFSGGSNYRPDSSGSYSSATGFPLGFSTLSWTVWSVSRRGTTFWWTAFANTQ